MLKDILIIIINLTITHSLEVNVYGSLSIFSIYTVSLLFFYFFNLILFSRWALVQEHLKNKLLNLLLLHQSLVISLDTKNVFWFCLSLYKESENETNFSLQISNAKTGRITKDYTLLNPPLGKGCPYSYINQVPLERFVKRSTNRVV